MSDFQLTDLFGVSALVLGGILVTAWLGAFVFSVYRYRRGALTAAEFHLWGGGVSMWVAFGLGQALRDLSGGRSRVVELAMFGSALVAIGFWVQWWRVRDGENEG